MLLCMDGSYGVHAIVRDARKVKGFAISGEYALRKHWLFFLVLTCAPLTATAVTMPHLYAATVPVADESASARADALQRALGAVMVRVSGDPHVTEFTQAASILEDARSVLQQYSYQSAGKEDLRLRAVFEGAALEAAMLAAGLPVWGQSRPLTMVWLLVDGALVTRTGSPVLVDAMQAAASRRGVPLRFPSADAAAGDKITPTDIRNRNVSRLMAVSAGYGSSHALLGEISEDAATWRLIEGADVLQRWRDRGNQTASLAAAGVSHSATVYARRYAAVGTETGRVVVAIQGIDGGDGYTRVRDFLRGLTAVNAVIPVLVDGENVVFRILGPNDAEALDRRISVAGWLQDGRLARDLATLYAGETAVLGYSIAP